jgi:hypothetical protein
MLVTDRALLSKRHTQFLVATVAAKVPTTEFMTWMRIFAVIFGTLGCHIKYVITIVTSTVIEVNSTPH